MGIEELVEKIMDRLKGERYYCSKVNGRISVVSNYDEDEQQLCKKILREELENFKSIFDKDVVENKVKCEIYEKIISKSNFKMVIEREGE